MGWSEAWLSLTASKQRTPTMTITAKIIADSIGPDSCRLITMQLRYPKFIHGEFMTHRVFSRNASSSRAIPVERLIQDILADPATPVFWGKNQAGMQAREELDEGQKALAQTIWDEARRDAVARAYAMHGAGAHKQIVNRIIEPWCHINVVVTSTEWDNFYALRRHPDAQPEMQALANAMWEAQAASIPRMLSPGEWHLPYFKSGETAQLLDGDRLENRIAISVARCARVSYLTHEGKTPNIYEDLFLYKRLVGSAPLHASPAEHQATPDEFDNGWKHRHEHGNLRGWRQFRQMLPVINLY